MPTTNPIRTAVPRNMGLPCDKPGTNRLNYAMGLSKLVLNCFGPPAYHVKGSIKGQASRAAARVTKTSLECRHYGTINQRFQHAKELLRTLLAILARALPWKDDRAVLSEFHNSQFFLINAGFLTASSLHLFLLLLFRPQSKST